MEVETPEVTKKRAVNNEAPIEQPDEPATKKSKLFSAKEFRQCLAGTTDKVAPLRDFLHLSKDETKGQKIVHDYIDKGGNCLEILNLLESESVPQILVLEVANIVLLHICASYPGHKTTAHEACRYLLNTHLNMVNKMLGLNSTGKERRVCLKILTAIVAFSTNLAKEILLHVHFQQSNLDLLTKSHSGNAEESQRNAFVQFLTAFLVDGHYPTITLLLSRKGLLTSMVHGLQYDLAETVCFVIVALKEHVLENPLVSKTVKMKTFGTHVVKNLVNLYNWKGPESYDPKNKKKNIVEVDQNAKSRVSECVHSFLLVLCTSHKHGVIFRDRQIGLSGSNTQHNKSNKSNNSSKTTRHSNIQNALLYTVLESLERPWEHSYAGDLITRVAHACPDLVKALWSQMKVVMEPRPAVGWLKVVNYGKELVEGLGKVEVVEWCVRDLTIHQYYLMLQMLLSPAPILKTLLIKECTYETNSIKIEVVKFLITSLEAISSYVVYSQKIHTLSDHTKLKTWLREYIGNHYPKVGDVLKKWDVVDEVTTENFTSYSQLDNLEVILQILRLYSELCPQLLENFSQNCDLTSLVKKLSEIEEVSKADSLKIQVIQLFVSYDLALFLPENELFSFVLPVLVQHFYNTNCSVTLHTLTALFKNTTVFDGSEYEIKIWLQSILSLKSYDDSVATFFVLALQNSTTNAVNYLQKLAKIRVEIDEVQTSNFQDIFDNLLVDNEDSNSVSLIKPNNLSPFILGCLSVLESSNKVNKAVKSCFNNALINLLHAQTNVSSLVTIISEESAGKVINENVLTYITSWTTESDHSLGSSKFPVSSTLISNIINGKISEFIKLDKTAEIIPEFYPSFFVSNLTTLGTLTLEQSEACSQLLKHVIKTSKQDLSKYIFGHPNLLLLFKPAHLVKNLPDGFATKFIIEALKDLHNSTEINLYISAYTSKLYKSLLKLIKKPNKNNSTLESLSEVISLFSFDYYQCLQLLGVICTLVPTDFINESNVLSAVYKITVYTLEKVLELSQNNFNLEPLSESIIGGITKVLAVLNHKTECFDTSKLAGIILKHVLLFPHNVTAIDDSVLFESILVKNEYCKDNAELAVVLLKSNLELNKILLKQVGRVVNKKGVMLPLLEVLIAQKVDEEVIKVLFSKYDVSINKALTKPQKAGAYFENHYKAIGELLTSFSTEDFAKSYYDKVCKFDVSETFHAYLLRTLYQKHVLTKEDGVSKEIALNNTLLTFVHLLLTLMKSKGTVEKHSQNLQAISELFNEYLLEVKETKQPLNKTSENESFRLFCKFCLKVGISGQSGLLRLLATFMSAIELELDDSALLFDMTVTHSEFLSVAQAGESLVKKELFRLLLVISERWPHTRKNEHMAVLLSSFTATCSDSDLVILQLLKLYESVPAQTNFYDFKPFLIGITAANHYSVKSTQRSLWRQPNMSDVLEFLDENTTLRTLKHFQNSVNLDSTTFSQNLPEQFRKNTYNLQFLLPLFTALLSAENAVQTYRFTRSGALSLTILSLASDCKEFRHSACFVLSRYYSHLEAKQTGKDHVMWLRFVQSLCKGLAVSDNLKLNNIAAIFLGKMVLVLTQPMHIMYTPLTNYLMAKDYMDVSTIPELYTLLSSSNMHTNEYRQYILEIVRDGLKTDNDFKIAAKSMLFKLIMDMYHLQSIEGQLEILNVILAAVNLKLGQTVLCNSHSLVPWLTGILSSGSKNPENVAINSVLIKILNKITGNSLSGLVFNKLVDFRLSYLTNEDDLLNGLLKAGIAIFSAHPIVKLDRERFEKLVNFIQDKHCLYMIKFKPESSVLLQVNLQSEKSKLICELTKIWLRQT